MSDNSLRERYEREIRRIVERLKETYDPEKIILFGSCARGNFHEDSDIDMLIVKETDKRRTDRIREVSAFLLDRRIPFEPLVYTPQELERQISAGDFFVETILAEGTVLYERAA